MRINNTSGKRSDEIFLFTLAKYLRLQLSLSHTQRGKKH